jgi:hypothetical protein
MKLRMNEGVWWSDEILVMGGKKFEEELIPVPHVPPQIPHRFFPYLLYIHVLQTFHSV